MASGIRATRASAVRWGAVGLTFVLAATSALAATITVTTTTDELTVNGACSLREAVRAANLDSAVDACAAGSGPDEIVFDPAVEAGFFSLALAGAGEDDGLTGDLDISAPLTIRGAGPQTIVDAGGIDRVFHVTAPVAVEFDGIAIRSGSADTGGGIFSHGPLTLRRCLIQNNHSGDDGGGLWTASSVVVEDTVFSSNSADEDGGGLFIFDASQLTVERSAFVQNSALNGAGLYVLVTPATIRDTSLLENQAGAVGGALHVQGEPMSIDGVTIARNGAVQEWPAGFSSSTVEVANTIFDGNWRNNVNTDDCLPSMDSLGHNIYSSESFSCAASVTPHATDLFVDPGLGGFPGDAGLPLAPGSPAIDAADATTCSPTDQFGQPRNVDGDADAVGRCDIGAVEFVPLVSAVHAQAHPAVGARLAVCLRADVSSSGETPGSYGVTLDWDPAILSFFGVEGGDPPFDDPVTNVTETDAGHLGLADAAAGGATNPQRLACVLFDVVGASGSSSPVELTVSSLFTAETFQDLGPVFDIAERPVDVAPACTIGDVNDDGAANSGDALLILASEIGLPIPAVTASALIGRCGDANGDTTADSIDANIILSAEVGLPVDPGFPLGDSNAAVDDCSACADVGCVSAPGGLVGWWDGDAIDGTQVSDIHGAHHGTAVGGMTSAAGHVGNALLFDGIDDRVEIADAPQLDLDDQMALALWTRVDHDLSEQHLVGKDGPNGWDLILYRFPPAVWEYRSVIDGGFGEIDCHDVSAGTWTHLVAQYDGTRAELYKDGSLCVWGTRTGTLETNAAPLILGGEAPHNLAGMLDEVQLFDRALDEDEIRSLWLAGSAGTCKAPASFAPQGLPKRADTAREARPAGTIVTRVQPVGNRDRDGDLELAVIVDTGNGATTLGSYGARLEWDRRRLALVDVKGGRSRGFERPLINRADADRGTLRISAASPRGASGPVEILRLRFRRLADIPAKVVADEVRLTFSSLGGPAPEFADLRSLLERGPAEPRRSPRKP